MEEFETLWDRLLPQARELIIQNQMRQPATTEMVIKTLQDTKYFLWTELPYHVVKHLHEIIYNAKSLDLIEEDEVKSIFHAYYE